MWRNPNKRNFAILHEQARVQGLRLVRPPHMSVDRIAVGQSAQREKRELACCCHRRRRMQLHGATAHGELLLDRLVWLVAVSVNTMRGFVDLPEKIFLQICLQSEPECLGVLPRVHPLLRQWLSSLSDHFWESVLKAKFPTKPVDGRLSSKKNFQILYSKDRCWRKGKYSDRLLQFPAECVPAAVSISENIVAVGTSVRRCCLLFGQFI